MQVQCSKGMSHWGVYLASYGGWIVIAKQMLFQLRLG